MPELCAPIEGTADQMCSSAGGCHGLEIPGACFVAAVTVVAVVELSRKQPVGLKCLESEGALGEGYARILSHTLALALFDPR
jgi:hypothetical protein